MGTKSKKEKVKNVQPERTEPAEEVTDEEEDVEAEEDDDAVVNSSDDNNADDDDIGNLEGMSDGEDDDVDPSAHGKLIASIQSLDAKKKQKGTIRGIPLAPNNLDLVVHANKDGSKITAADLKMKEKQNKKELKKPLSSGELELAKRRIARESMVTETTKWDPIVNEMRLAPQIKYNKQEHGIALYETLRPKKFVPRTPLEQELYAALGKSEDIMHPDKELTEAEEKALKSMSIKEARARRAELMKHHELLNRMELKAKRLKRIKSKKYRKILRREKEANDKKDLEQLQKTDPEAFLERMELLEKARMEERLTLKHRGGGKFSRLHKAYSKFDDKTRTSIQEMLQKSKELTKKREDSSSDEEEMEEESGKLGVDENSEMIGTSSSENQTLGQQLKSMSKKAGGWLDGPTKFVYDKKEDSDSKEVNVQKEDGEDDLEMEGDGETKSLSVVEVDSDVVEIKENESKTKGKKRKIAETDDSDSDQKTSKLDNSSVTGDNDVINTPNTPEEPKSKKKKKNKKKKNVEKKVEDPEKPATQTTLMSIDEEDGENEEEDEEGDGQMKVTMEELFEDEDFVEEFAREKAELEEKSRPKVQDLKLPGWGSWAGPDYKEAQKAKAAKKKKPVVKQQAKKPTAARFVWLNPNRDEHMRKLQPKKVPFPYSSVQQYEASLRQPVSRGLVCETATKLLTKPAMVTKQGHIIKAIDKEDYFSESTGIFVDEDDKNFGGEVKEKSTKKPNKRRSVR